MKRLPIALALTCASLLARRALAHDILSFEEDIKPFLHRSCGGTDCHLNRSESGVELTTFETLMASTGEQYARKIVIPGDPDSSPIVDKVQSELPAVGDPMPREGERLSPDEIADLRRWIQEGARKYHLPTRGDYNEDDTLNITDAVTILGFLFLGAPEARCPTLGDANSDGEVNLTDAVFVLNYLFLGGAAPVQLTDEQYDTCQRNRELSFASIHEKVFATSCAFSSCHSTERHKGGLSLETPREAYDALVGVAPVNETALAARMLRVDPGKPENSFLLHKLMEPGPGEGNRMPANSTAPLSEATVRAFREWILAGAPFEGTVPGVPDISDVQPPPSDRIPQPPVPENGIQIHLGPFQVAPRSEREIFFYVDKPLANLPEDVFVERIDVHMSDESHHFILYQWIGATKPPAGVRDNSFADFLSSQRFIVGVQQAYFSLSFPTGVGLKMTRDESFDLNSHYLNLSRDKPLDAEVYVNIFFAPKGSVTTIVKPIFDINPSINVPPHQTRTTKWSFPGLTSTQADPALGSGGKVTKETHIYALSSHMHRHGTRFTASLIQNGKDVVPPQMIYDNHDWDDPLNLIFTPPLVLAPGQGLRFETTQAYDDPPSDNSPPLTFGPTSEDEMAILLGFYAIKQ